MPPPQPPRPPAGAIAAILGGLRRAPQQIRRSSRDVVETAVSQLFDAAVQPHGVAASGEYRIEELARLAGSTTRNIRVYRDRGLLHPPLRVGRIVLFNDTHLTRLRLITSMLDRGYTIAHVHEMLNAWEQGKDIGDVLGLENAIAGSWATEKSERMPVAQARELIDDDAAFDRLCDNGLIKLAGEDAIILRPKLIEAFNDIRRYGIGIDTLIDVHERVLPHVDEISSILVQAGVDHLAHRIKPGEPLPADTEVAELITMLVRFRTQAVAAVTATLAVSIESTIENVVAQMLTEYLGKDPGADEPT
ncbi:MULTISPECIES: MerR family transcriptional regulator [Mycobacteriaceae]|jgi:DNA-binding transcriptional MerR regulator|uniref:MerR HTH family regulatory protein n=1 Tax=Mycolicibacterium fluoranthenivorans TaxID=258505 RepID=A0A1G4WWV9_9MYCO|nr:MULTISPECIES: MerR family transcriptional regulator [Mycobacteriaceae]MCV7252256.1 MerR family transcriptional regulator [Mycobacterium hackensackense]SCX31284.1 MerR HTH family regulatory protein [Mycolicibacterium fluoranthenivorans]